MSDEDLQTLFRTLAEDVDDMPQREYSVQAWDRAQHVRRRRIVLTAAAAVVLAAVPVALLAPRHHASVPPTQPMYSDTPLRSRAAHTATLLPDGRVLIVGGCATDGCTTAAGTPTSEFYVPGHGFTAGPELNQPRQGHSAALLRDGRVLVVGGWAREGSPPLDSAEVYEPRTGRFETVGPLTVRRGANAAVVLHDGRVFIVGGADDPTATELFDPQRGAFTVAAPLPEGSGAGGVVALSDGRVLVVGGQDEHGDARPSAIYDPTGNAWQLTGSLRTPRSRFALAALPDGRVMVLGGTPDDRQLLASTEIYDPATGAFSPGPSMDIERYKFVAVMGADGRIIVGGGTRLAVYDDGQFRSIPGTAGPIRWVPTVTPLPDGDILVLGGYDDRIRLRGDAQLVTASQVALQ